MPLDIHCPQCSQQYRVAESVLGQRVRCRQCGQTFAAAAAAATSSPHSPSPPESFTPAPFPLGSPPAHPLGPMAGAQWPGLPATPPYGGSRLDVSNPSGGPTDGQMRLVCCGMLALGAILSAASLLLEGATGVLYLAVLLLAPLSVVVGISGLVSPNVVRAMGKYGGHLPGSYKIIGWGLMGLAFVAMMVLTIGVFAVGFRPMRPGGGGGGGGGGGADGPSLGRKETAEVLERIRASYEASPDAVRNVTFPVFSASKPDAEAVAAAERVLGPVPGYVAGSFKLSADRKTVSFQYRGNKEAAIPYALLLPGQTGLYFEFTPQFAE